MKELEYRAALLGTRGDGCPDALAPLAAGESSCPLGDLAVNDDKSNGLFGEVVRGLNFRRRDKLEVGLSVFAEAPGNVHGLRSRRRPPSNLQDRLSNFLQLGLKPLRRHALSSMNDAEERADLLEKPFGEASRNFVQLLEELDVANQVRETELHAHVEVAHEFAIRREVIAAEDAIEFFAEDIGQDIRAPRLVDTKEGEELRTKTPSPELFAALLVPRLVDVHRPFVGKLIPQLRVWFFQSAAHLADDLGDHPGTEGHSQNLTEEGLGRRVGTVTAALEVRDCCAESRPDESAIANLSRNHVVVNLVTLRTVASVDLMSMEKDGLIDKLVLVVRLCRLRDKEQIAAAALRTRLEGMSVLHVDVFGLKLPLVLVVTGLPSRSSLAPTFWFRLLRLDDVGGRGLRGRRGVFARHRQPCLEFFQPRRLLLDQFLEPGDLFLEFSASLVPLSTAGTIWIGRFLLHNDGIGPITRRLYRKNRKNRKNCERLPVSVWVFVSYSESTGLRQGLDVAFVLCRQERPARRPAIALDQTAYGKHGLYSGQAPTHSRTLQAFGGECLARCLDHATADWKILIEEIFVSHPVTIPSEVFQLRLNRSKPPAF